MTVATLNVGPEIKNAVTVTLRVRGVRRAELRLRVAAVLIQFAAWVGGVGFRERFDVE